MGVEATLAAVLEAAREEHARLQAELFDARRIQEAAEAHATWQDEENARLRAEVERLHTRARVSLRLLQRCLAALRRLGTPTLALTSKVEDEIAMLSGALAREDASDA